MLKTHVEVTTVVARHIKPGHEKQFENWMHRISKAVAKWPGFRGITIIGHKEEPLVRHIVYRFSDRDSLEQWERSSIKKKFIAELKPHATQHYARATGLETWFTLHEHHLRAPPKWKMFLTAFSGVFIVSAIARVLLAQYTDAWNFFAATAFYGALTVAVLTWAYMPLVTRLLRRWLYPE